MGGLSMLLMAGQQTLTSGQMSTTDPKMTSSQPPVTSGMTGLTITDQRTTELTSSRSNTSNWEFGSWSTMAPSIKRMDTETEVRVSVHSFIHIEHLHSASSRKLLQLQHG